MTEEGNTRRKRRTDEPDPKDRAREQGGLAGGRQEPRSFEPMKKRHVAKLWVQERSATGTVGWTSHGAHHFCYRGHSRMARSGAQITYRNGAGRQANRARIGVAEASRKW